MLNARVTFGGIDKIIGARFTLGRSTQPGVGTISFLPQDNFEVGGPQTFTWISDIGTLTFPKCVLDVQTLTKREEVNRTDWHWDATVYDRRWFWWKYTLDGRWNLRNLDGTVRADTKKTARELAELCLDTFEETGYDASGMPNNVYPPMLGPVNAAAYLAWLLEWCGCVLGFDKDGNVQIKPHGEGDDFPANFRINPRSRYTLGSAPEKLLAVSGPTLYQSRLKLAALMVDADDEVAMGPDEVAYAPTNGWAVEPWISFQNVERESRDKALSQFCRWFQIVSQADGTFVVPGTDTACTNIRQWLPLLPTRISYFQDAGIQRRWQHKPQLVGNFWPQSELPINVENHVWAGAFSVEQETGLVTTEYPIFTVDEDGTGAPDLKLCLEAAYRVRAANGQLDRLEETRNVAGHAGTKVLVRPEVFGTVIQKYDDSGATAGLTDNRVDARDELNAYLDVFAKRYEADALVYEEAECLGFQACALDGKTAQLVLKYGYGLEPTITASRGFEVDVYNLSYEEFLRNAEHLLMMERMA